MKHKILIVPDKEKDAIDGRLRCRIRWNGNVYAILVGYRVIIAKWSYESQRCKANSTHNGYTASSINIAIEKLIHNIEESFAFFDNLDLIPSLDEFKEHYIKTYTNKTPKVNAPQTLLQLIDAFVSFAGSERNWTDASYKKFRTLSNHVIGFHDIPLKEMNIDYYNEFLEYLISTANLVNTSALKSLGCLRWCLNWAYERQYITSNDHKIWHPKLKTANTKVIFLTWDELMRVYSYPLKDDYQKRVRDVFCFCSFSGLRYSDVHNLKKSDISDDMISFTSIKDHEQLNVNLNYYSKSILDKYKDIDGEKALPVISNQRYNEFIKEVMKACELDTPITIVSYQGNKRIETTKKKWELITTHTARKTFVCHALSLNIPVDVVMKWTGHSDYRAMRPYIDVADEVKRTEMAKFDKR